MKQIEQDWLLELAAAGLLEEGDRSRLQELLRQDVEAGLELARRQRLHLLLAQLPAVPDHDSAGLSQQVMQAIRTYPTWQMTEANAAQQGAVLDPILGKTLPAVPMHESAVFQALLREKLGQPQDRVEYLACGLAGGFLDRDESAAAAHRLATDPNARKAFAGHEKLDRLLGQWSQEAERAVAVADLGPLHSALAAEIAPPPMAIPFVRPKAEPTSSRVPQSRVGFRRFGWLIGGLAAAAVIGAVWFGVRMQLQGLHGPSSIIPGINVAYMASPRLPVNISKTPQEMELAFAGPSLGPAILSKDAVLLVAVAPASIETANNRPMDEGLLPADDADARPRGTVTVAVDNSARPAGQDEIMAYF